MNLILPLKVEFNQRNTTINSILNKSYHIFCYEYNNNMIYKVESIKENIFKNSC